MDFTTRARRLVFALLLLVPLVNVGHAGADGSLESVLTHRQISTTGFGEMSEDPTCPWSAPGIDPNAALDEGRSKFSAVYRTRTGKETLYLSECWENTTGNGGRPINGGDWTIVRSDGTLTGYVVGGGNSAFNDGDGTDLLLATERGTGTLANAKGTLHFWTCENTFGTTAGAIRLTRSRRQSFAECRTS